MAKGRIGFALACALCVQVLALAVTASASAQRLVVLRIDPAAEPLCEALEGALGNYELAADPGYLAETQRRRLDPSSDEALTLLTPPLQVQLALVPQGAEGGAAQIEFRDGQSGASLGTASIPLQGGALGWQGRRVLEMEIQKRLAAPQAEPNATEGEPPSTEEMLGPEPSPEGGDESAQTSSEEGGLYLYVFGGAGMGMRDVSWPVSGETLKVETGAFLAYELGTGFGLVLSKSALLGPELAYQSSLDHEMKEQHIDGASDTIGIRSHRFEALLALTFRLGGDGGFHIAPALGYALRNLRPYVHHLLTPSYTLAGPMFRLTLRIPFGDSVALRLSPEMQYVLVGDDLEERGVDATGLAFGGQAGFEISLAEEYTLELTFREAHAVMASDFGGDATDVERFVTARLVWQP